MSEIKHAGVKGYVVMGGLIALFLFTILCIYIYKANQNMVPEDPERWSSLLTTLAPTLG